MARTLGGQDRKTHILIKELQVSSFHLQVLHLSSPSVLKGQLPASLLSQSSLNWKLWVLLHL